MFLSGTSGKIASFERAAGFITFTVCHPERARGSKATKRESKDPEDASLSNADSGSFKKRPLPSQLEIILVGPRADTLNRGRWQQHRLETLIRSRWFDTITPMPNVHKANVLQALRTQFGELRKLSGSESLFAIGDSAARIYLRYSKIHEKGRTFFGLRELDLQQLEGHNSFLCFVLDDGSPPLFVPYADFEEVFRNAETAKDGQFKVQLISRADARELYLARQGRFNVEGYVGYEVIRRSLDASLLRTPLDLTHPQVQTLLGAIGNKKGYEIWVPASNISALDWSLTDRFSLRKTIPSGFDSVRHILAEIDMIWVERGRETIAGLFEVEHSTPIYSGLLRFNDILLTDSRLSRFSIVSNDTRRSLFATQLRRPTFVRSGLSELTTFLEYANVAEWHTRIMKLSAGGDL